MVDVIIKDNSTKVVNSGQMDVITTVHVLMDHVDFTHAEPCKYIIYSYKYLESDLIKHCHMIFIHSLGQPLIVRSHSKVHHSRGSPREIPM